MQEPELTVSSGTTEEKEKDSKQAVASKDLKEETIDQIAAKVYQTEELLVDAVNYCCENGNNEVSMEEYVRRHFSYLLPKFPEVAEVYCSEVKKRQASLRKARRRASKKAR
jgi:hypothetical protein